MIYFTKYAEKKFEILNNHSVFIRKEEVEAAVTAPDAQGTIGNYMTAEKEGVKVIYELDKEIKKIITFYPL